MSHIVVNGFVGQDPEVKISAAGKVWTKISLAKTERKKVGGEWEDAGTTWYSVMIFDPLASHVCEIVKKGDRLLVSGRFSVDRWTGDDGQERETATIMAEQVGVIPFVKKKDSPF